MKKIKLFLFVALFGAMTLGAYSAYDYLTLSADEKALLENVEALTSGETPGGGESGGSKPGWSGRTWTGNVNDSALNRLGSTADCIQNAKYIGSGDRISCRNFN